MSESSATSCARTRESRLAPSFLGLYGCSSSILTVWAISEDSPEVDRSWSIFVKRSALYLNPNKALISDFEMFHQCHPADWGDFSESLIHSLTEMLRLHLGVFTSPQQTHSCECRKTSGHPEFSQH